MSYDYLAAEDPQIADAIGQELSRQRSTIELIASENIASLAVMQAMGTVLTNKYAEGYSGKRYYGGCEKVDIVEDLAIERACKLFDCKFANVQPHSGANANLAAYQALINLGDTVLGLSLDHGGHLTHGSPVNFSGKDYNIVSYGVNPETELIDYDEIERLAKEHKPKLIVGGASAYPRIIDFKRMREIADEVGAYLMIDMAHIAGLVAAGLHPSPVPYAHVVTSTSHKTLRGPRGGFILTNDEALAKKIKTYMENVVKNCAAMGEGMVEGGLRLVSGGTDNHLVLVDLTPADITGKDAEKLLESVGLTVNKNTIPNEKRSPFVTSGIRVGTAAGTTRGFDADEFHRIGQLIAATVFNAEDEARLAQIKEEVAGLIAKHPLYPEL